MADYVPRSPAERALYEHLWSVANEDGAETLGGAAAVQFLGRSSVNTGMLRQIWAMCTAGPTITKDHFFSVLRLICMFQNGDFPITREQMAKSANEDFPPPVFSGVSMPPPPQVTAGAPPAGLPPPAAYAMAPEEKLRYDTLFANYDSDHDGFLLGGEAVNIFSQSGLDVQILRAVWNLADDDKDSKLSALEFAVAFHLIVCVSKKGLPVPPGLPSPLRAFLASGGKLSPDLDQAKGPRAVHPEPRATASVPAPARLSVSDAFGSVESDITKAPQIQDAGRSVSVSDSEEVSNGVLDLTSATKKLIGTQNAALEVSERAVSSVRGLIQRLATERVSIAAAAANAEADVLAQNAKLQAALEELGVLRAQCDELRQRHGEALENRGTVEKRLSQAAVERQSLLSSIDDTRRSITQLTSDRDAAHNGLTELAAKTGAERERQAAIGLATNKAHNETAGLNGEIETLTRILMSLNEDKSSRGVELQRLKNQLADAQLAFAEDKAKTVKQGAELESITADNRRLHSEVARLLAQIATSRDIESRPKSPVAALKSPEISPYSVAAKVDEPSIAPKVIDASPNPSNTRFEAVNHVSGTNAFADDGFGKSEFGVSATEHDNGFGASAFVHEGFAPVLASDGFDGFGATAGDDAFGNPFAGDGFGDVSVGPIDTFGVSNDGFNAAVFGEPQSHVIADDGFGSAVVADGFGDGFGSAVAADGFGDGFGSAVAADGFGDGFGSAVAANGFGDGFGSAVEADGFGSPVVADGFGDSAADGFGDGFGSAVAADGFTDGFDTRAEDNLPQSKLHPDDRMDSHASSGRSASNKVAQVPPLLSERPKHGASAWDVAATSTTDVVADDGFGGAFDSSGFGNDTVGGSAFDDGFGGGLPNSDAAFGTSSAFNDGFGDSTDSAIGAGDPFSSAGADLGW